MGCMLESLTCSWKGSTCTSMRLLEVSCCRMLLSLNTQGCGSGNVEPEYFVSLVMHPWNVVSANHFLLVL